MFLCSLLQLLPDEEHVPSSSGLESEYGVEDIDYGQMLVEGELAFCCWIKNSCSNASVSKNLRVLSSVQECLLQYM